MERLQSSCLHLSRVPYLTSIGQNGKNSCDVDSHFVVNAYVLIIPNVIELVKSSGCFSNPDTYFFIDLAIRCNFGTQLSELSDLLCRVSIDSNIYGPILWEWVLRRIFPNYHDLCFLCVHL